MPTRRDLAKIHIAKQELRLDDTTYRNILQKRYQLDSAADLSTRQAADLIELFRAKGWRPASRGQLGLIHVLWHKLHTEGSLQQENEAALHAFIGHSTGRDELQQLTAFDASRVIEMLKQWLAREENVNLRH